MSQEHEVLRYLFRGRPLTAAQAVNKWGCYRLAARVKSLRNKGFLIDSSMIRRNGKHWAQYRLDLHG